MKKDIDKMVMKMYKTGIQKLEAYLQNPNDLLTEDEARELNTGCSHVNSAVIFLFHYAPTRLTEIMYEKGYKVIEEAWSVLEHQRKQKNKNIEILRKKIEEIIFEYLAIYRKLKKARS